MAAKTIPYPVPGQRCWSDRFARETRYGPGTCIIGRTARPTTAKFGRAATSI